MESKSDIFLAVNYVFYIRLLLSDLLTEL